MSDDDINDSQKSKLKQVTAKEFAAKYATKRDVWRLLNVDCKWFIPPADTVTIWHLRELASRQRTRIKRRGMRTIVLPQYDGLTMEDLLTYARQREDVMRALPAVQHEILKLPKKYVAEVILNIVGDPFEEWVSAQINARNAKYKEEHEENLDLDSSVEEVFQNSTTVASKYAAETFNLVLVS